MKTKNIFARSWLTDKERIFFLTVVGLLLLGWAARSYRLSHPSKSREPVKQENK
ncbi:MAG: hypothetical protein ABJC04_03810 [Verrucomicrobiota bacterium]